MEGLESAVREFLVQNPGASKRQLREGVDGAERDIEEAFAQLVMQGLARYEPPERKGMAGQCYAADAPSASASAKPSPEGSWKPARRCPRCARYPSVRFSEREVKRAAGRRQAQLVQNVRCACSQLYWIRVRDIAKATLDEPKAVA